MRGLVLAGGKGTRLLPATRVVNKHMIPIINQPMITYPLETLKTLGVKDIMVVSGGDHIGGIAEFLGDGSEFNVSLTYRVQKDAGGIAQALSLAEDFAKGESILVILGDNVFGDFTTYAFNKDTAVVFLKEVKDPQRFGVAELDTNTNVIDIEEKPSNPKSNFAVTGLYYYPADVFDIVKTLKPSARGELEITDVNNYYIHNNRCEGRIIQGFWSDAGTPESLLEVTKWAFSNRNLSTSG